MGVARQKTKKFKPDGGDTVAYLSAWGGEWLSNNGEYISAYRFTAPKAGM